MFYHSEKLQSTKTTGYSCTSWRMFYHSEKLQSTKTFCKINGVVDEFYHSEKLQSTKTKKHLPSSVLSFIIAKNYRELKHSSTVDEL